MTRHDPEFWEKAGDVCGLYLDPPENAMVWLVDEKTGIQAKSRVNPTKPAIPAPAAEDGEDAASGADKPRGKPVRQEFEYKRNGTAMLFAALDVHGGEVAGWVADSSRSTNFVAFLGDLITYTPTHAPWLNQVELFFSIMQRRLLRSGEFASVDDLTRRIIEFINDYNRNAKPFKWTYAGRPLPVA